MNHPNRRRIWQSGDSCVFLRDEDDFGRDIVREFWVPSKGGYVREIDVAHPGTLGQQVCNRLSHQGSTLSATRDSLLDLIRREYRRAVAYDRRQSNV